MAEDEANRDLPPSPDFNPVDWERRRQFIKERFGHARQCTSFKFELCVKLQSAGFDWLGAAFFDYLADFASWAGYIEDRKLDHDQFCWPWTRDAQPKLVDESRGRSQIFKAWLDAEAHSASTINDPKGAEPKTTPTI
ncbi:hypothetical protein NW766_005780 [Fusarium irregulare]|uniref:Uncharacterized protein n=1 Tax=Fusarium irregulare TaxID=2494466 RepID=A0A9W8UB78_9HYPO|nr:hypothetical protein NW766_005780 [Fusarium irregulare]